MDKTGQGVFRPHHSKLVFVYRAMDSALIVACLYISLLAYNTPFTNYYVMLSLVAVASFSIFAESVGVYSSLRVTSFVKLIAPIIVNWLLVAFGCLALGYFTKMSAVYSRLATGTWLLLTPGVLVFFRLATKVLLSQLRLRGHNTRRVAIVGAGAQGNRLAANIQQTPSLGMNLLGFYDNRQAGERIPDNLVAPIIGDFDDIEIAAKSGQVDLVYIAISLKGEECIAQIISKLRDTTVSVHLVPDFFVYDLLHSRWANIGTVPTLSVFESPFMSIDGWLKRLEDIVLSSCILLLIAIPMLITSIAVKATSPGPVIFKQRRYGLDGRSIKIWKFRTMTTCDDGDTIVQATKNDARVTKLGAFLRKTSMDELPQFINVLRGEMSIVGPRPHAVAHNENYRKLISGYMLRHKVPPGITGWAQVNGWRGETDTLEKMEKRLEHDLWYIRSWSVYLDLKIIFKTIVNGFRPHDVY